MAISTLLKRRREREIDRVECAVGGSYIMAAHTVYSSLFTFTYRPCSNLQADGVNCSQSAHIVQQICQSTASHLLANWGLPNLQEATGAAWQSIACPPPLFFTSKRLHPLPIAEPTTASPATLPIQGCGWLRDPRPRQGRWWVGPTGTPGHGLAAGSDNMTT